MLIDDEKAQISAEMILLLGVLLVLVTLAGRYIFYISNSTAGNVSNVVTAAKNSTINKM
jgi:uncharacterized protein (UPF0333 family)